MEQGSIVALVFVLALALGSLLNYLRLKWGSRRRDDDDDDGPSAWGVG